MSILLIRFEKDVLNYYFLDDFDKIGNEKINFDKISFNWLEWFWEKYFRILEELNLLYTKYNPKIIFYHSSKKTQRWLDEIRYSNEAFLNYYCFKNNINLVEVNKTLCRKMLNITKKDFDNKFEKNKYNIISSKWIGKSNILLEWFVLLLLIKWLF